MNQQSNKRFLVPLWWVRLTRWEYWNFYFFYLPVFAYIAWLALRARAWVFFSACNPGIENSGLAGESKRAILEKLPSEWLPPTGYLQAGAAVQAAEALMQSLGIDFPIILKPDVGERGRYVEKINDLPALEKYMLSYSAEPLVLQGYVPYPVEAGILYYIQPGEVCGTVSSIVLKEMLHVVGDGHSTLHELVLQNTRARFVVERLRADFGSRWNEVLPTGERLELVSIGNHIRGTMFLNGNRNITPALTEQVDALVKQFGGLYFCRFDVRAESEASLREGRFTILELNGVASEPVHIYDPRTPLVEAYRVLLQHWHVIYKISIANHKAGVRYLTLRELVRIYRDYRRAHA